jgi:hypothetical protein
MKTRTDGNKPCQLVPCLHRRQDDPSGGSAENGEPGRAITVETPGSHAIYVSNPGAVANLIQQAAAHRD